MVFERALTGNEQSATYQEAIDLAFATGKAHNGAALMGIDVDQLSRDLRMEPNTSLSVKCAPASWTGGIVEVFLAGGKLTAYDWGLMHTLTYYQTAAAQGEPILSEASPAQLKALPDLLAKAGMAPFASGIDSVNVYLNEMPRRKPDQSVEWVPAYLVVPYAGDTASDKMVANAETGEVYLPHLTP